MGSVTLATKKLQNCLSFLRSMGPRRPQRTSLLPLLLLLLLGIGLIGFPLARLQAQVSSSVSGFSTLQIRGHHNLSPSALSFVGFGFVRFPVYQGRLDSFASGSISDSRAQWLDGQFEGNYGPHYFEITSGPYAGFTANIVATLGLTKTIQLDSDLSALLTGTESFTIRPHWTVASVFGPADESGLGAGSNVTADEVLTLDSRTGKYTSYSFRTAGLGGRGWRSSASASIDQANAVIPLGQGILIRRKQPDDLFLKIFGAVKTGNTLLPVAPGMNIVANILPSAVTLNESGLYTGDAAAGLAGGSNVAADKLLLFDGSTYSTFYYKTTGLGGTGWRSAAAPAIDAGLTIIPAGAAILIDRAASRPAFFWKVAGD